MNEELIQSRLKKISVLVVCISILLFASGSAVSHFLQNSLLKVTQEQMKAEAEEYRSRILKQIDADFQSLNTLSSFLEYHSEKSEQLSQRLEKANQNNDFLTMAYYPLSGNGILATLDQETQTDVSLSTLNEESKEVIKKAWKGESSVSKLFLSDISHERIFAYGVPVYEDGIIIGALAASDHVDIFSDILSGNTVFGGNGYIHMVSTEGKFLIKSENSAVKEETASIFDGPYVQPDQKKAVQSAMQNQEQIVSSFQYHNKTYQFLLEPVHLNGWYLLCVNTRQGASSSVYHMIQTMQLTLTGIIFLAIFLILYGYRLLRKSNRELIQLAYHDALTGADNLSCFTLKLPKGLKKSDGCVAILNVRQFTFINEIFGKQQANKLLCYIKAIIEKHLRQEEFFCRDTSDWFYLFLRETDKKIIQSRLSALLDEITNHHKSRHSNYQLVLYCGAALSDKISDTEKEANNLITRALFALEKAKGAYQNHIWFYDAEMHKIEEMENYIESHMHQALADGEFKLFLQPKIDLKTNTLGGAEALVRWVTSTGKTIFPDQFIPLFENNGFCIQLDKYMVECVCRQIQKWMEQGIPPIPISVNQSKLMFFEANYLQILTDTTEKYGISPNLVTLEILEGVALQDVEKLNKKIEQLRKIGFRISMDDFGSGFSSLNTLGKLNIDELKLDRAFLQDISKHSHRAKLIMEQVIHMAKQLCISTVVEGVETAEHEKLIRAMGSDYGQGYYYSKPIPADEFHKTYMAHRSANQ